MDIEEYENISAYMRDDKLTIVKGTIRPTLPSSHYYDHVEYVPKPRSPATPESLVMEWLADDEDDPCPEDLRQEWLDHAADFLDTVTYPTNEHLILLALAFTKYLQRIGRL